MTDQLPHFFGLGVQKGGTTTLQRLLEQHPDVFLSPAKELHYFSLHYGRGESWYRQQFAGASPEQRCGDITPYYLFHPQVAGRLQALLPEARLIVMLRDPVERCLSQYFHACRLGLEVLPLEQALAAEQERLAGAERVLSEIGGRHQSHQEHSYQARSRYEQQLPRWEAAFGQAQLMVLRSEALFEQPELIWSQILSFLELDSMPLPSLPGVANAGLGESALVSAEVRDQLRDRLAPTYAWVHSHYGLTWP